MQAQTSDSFNSRPHEEVDIAQNISPLEYLVFQFTTSRRGRPNLLCVARLTLILSIHDLTKRSTLPGTIVSLRPYLSIHDLTKRSTAPVRTLRASAALSIHDLTKRSTNLTASRTSRSSPFNSRPHEEVDVSSMFCLANRILSIHDLTKRSTRWNVFDPLGIVLSIHDLTKRST